MESADTHKALAEIQTKNATLQEQLSVQRQLLRELETQLHESQRMCAQLRTQVTSPHSLHCTSASPLPVSSVFSVPDKPRSVSICVVLSSPDVPDLWRARGSVFYPLNQLRLNVTVVEPQLCREAGDDECEEGQWTNRPQISLQVHPSSLPPPSLSLPSLCMLSAAAVR